MDKKFSWNLLLEHVSIKWIPVNRKNMRLNKNLERVFDSIKTNRALNAIKFVV